MRGESLETRRVTKQAQGLQPLGVRNYFADSAVVATGGAAGFAPWAPCGVNLATSTIPTAIRAIPIPILGSKWAPLLRNISTA